MKVVRNKKSSFLCIPLEDVAIVTCPALAPLLSTSLVITGKIAS